MIAQKNPSRFAAQSRRAQDVSADTKEASPASHEQFLQMMPSIVRHARIRFRCLSPAMRKDAVDDVVCLAFAAYARLVELGKEDIAYATPLAGYAVAQYRAGRRVGLRRNVHDVLSDALRYDMSRPVMLTPCIAEGFVLRRQEHPSATKNVSQRRATPSKVNCWYILQCMRTDSRRRQLDQRGFLGVLRIQFHTETRE
jgi:hypothetical protein